MKNQALQVGYPKSGNYLVYRIIRELQEKTGCFSSYVELSGVAQMIQRYAGKNLIFRERAAVDHIRLMAKEFYIEIPDPSFNRLRIDKDLLLKYSSLVWSHETLCDLANTELGQFNIIYLLRDGRDVLNSQMHHVIRPQSLRLNPEYTLTEIDQVYSNLEYFRYSTRKWVHHVQQSLSRAGTMPNVLVMRFEDIINDPPNKIRDISQFLGLGEDFNFSRLGEELVGKQNDQGFGHIRSGTSGDWRAHFTREHTEIFRELAGGVLKEAGYSW